MLGYDQPMGDLRQAGYDMGKVWHSEQASEVRAYIKGRNCACPLANQAYSNILCDPIATLRAGRTLLGFQVASAAHALGVRVGRKSHR